VEHTPGGQDVCGLGFKMCVAWGSCLEAELYWRSNLGQPDGGEEGDSLRLREDLGQHYREGKD
jgi:hypothetical protein